MKKTNTFNGAVTRKTRIWLTFQTFSIIIFMFESFYITLPFGPNRTYVKGFGIRLRFVFRFHHLYYYMWSVPWRAEYKRNADWRASPILAGWAGKLIHSCRWKHFLTRYAALHRLKHQTSNTRPPGRTTAPRHGNLRSTLFSDTPITVSHDARRTVHVNYCHRRGSSVEGEDFSFGICANYGCRWIADNTTTADRPVSGTRVQSFVKPRVEKRATTA